MDYILSFLLPFLLLYKYVGLFIVSYLAAFLLPLPSSSLLAASGAFAAQGYFNITYVLIVALVGNILGDMTGYFLARFYGVRLLEKIGFKRLLHSKIYTLLTSYMGPFSYSLIFFSRFLTAIGPLVNILSGITKVRYNVFFGIEILGEIAYVALYGLVGYFLGSEWETNLSFFFKATLVIVSLGLTVVVVQYGIFKRMRRLSKE